MPVVFAASLNFRSLPPVQIGERIVVENIRYAEAYVKDVMWEHYRWLIIVDWGNFGLSKVYSDDENKTWFRYDTAS